MPKGHGVQNPSFRQRIGYHAMLLGGFATITGALVVVADLTTREDIRLRQEEDIKRSLSQVIHPDMHTNDLLQDITELQVKGKNLTFYRARSNKKIVAFAFKMSGQGYAGPIELMLGVDESGKLLGVRVLSHIETPGLGDKIEEKKDDWIYGFSGLSLSNPSEEQWKVKKDGGYFDQFTGATITPRAVVNTIKLGLDVFNAHKNQLLTDTPETQPETHKASAIQVENKNPSEPDQVQATPAVQSDQDQSDKTTEEDLSNG